jgi:hypothetical protein
VSPGASGGVGTGGPGTAGEPGGGGRSVGVVTPFRAQADALEQAILARFDADELAALDLRVGTVHAFQGNERDVVIMSLGVGAGGPAAAWRFVDDPHLVAVLATRARRRVTVVTACDPPDGGLVAAYLAAADAGPGPLAPGPTTAWARTVAADLALAGHAATAGYRTGRHVLDVCVPARGGDVAVECDVHPDGPDAHVERHLALRRAGWTVVEAHRSRGEHRLGELVTELATTLGPPTDAPPPVGPTAVGPPPMNPSTVGSPAVGPRSAAGPAPVDARPADRR